MPPEPEQYDVVVTDTAGAEEHYTVVTFDGPDKAARLAREKHDRQPRAVPAAATRIADVRPCPLAANGRYAVPRDAVVDRREW